MAKGLGGPPSHSTHLIFVQLAVLRVHSQDAMNRHLACLAVIAVITACSHAQLPSAGFLTSQASAGAPVASPTRQQCDITVVGGGPVSPAYAHNLGLMICLLQPKWQPIERSGPFRCACGARRGPAPHLDFGITCYWQCAV